MRGVSRWHRKPSLRLPANASYGTRKTGTKASFMPMPYFFVVGASGPTVSRETAEPTYFRQNRSDLKEDYPWFG